MALLDFEDGTGTCVTNSPATNTKVVGSAPSNDDYTSLELSVGVPAGQDHLSVETAVAPLNDPDLFWSWTGGYKYMKIEIDTTGNPQGYFFHLGAEECHGEGSDVTCTFPNVATIPLSGFAPGTSHVAFDLATLYADSNVDEMGASPTDPVVGCMSSTGDPECPPLFAKLGLAFEGGAAPVGQTLFVAAP